MEYEERNIRVNPDWIDEVIALGSESTPTTVIEGEDGEQQVVIGFRKNDLGKHLKLRP